MTHRRKCFEPRHFSIDVIGTFNNCASADNSPKLSSCSKTIVITSWLTSSPFMRTSAKNQRNKVVIISKLKHTCWTNILLHTRLSCFIQLQCKQLRHFNSMSLRQGNGHSNLSHRGTVLIIMKNSMEFRT